jgi:hypothetical protein
MASGVRDFIEISICDRVHSLLEEKNGTYIGD